MYGETRALLTHKGCDFEYMLPKKYRVDGCIELFSGSLGNLITASGYVSPNVKSLQRSSVPIMPPHVRAPKGRRRHKRFRRGAHNRNRIMKKWRRDCDKAKSEGSELPACPIQQHYKCSICGSNDHNSKTCYLPHDGLGNVMTTCNQNHSIKGGHLFIRVHKDVVLPCTLSEFQSMKSESPYSTMPFLHTQEGKTEVNLSSSEDEHEIEAQHIEGCSILDRKIDLNQKDEDNLHLGHSSNATHTYLDPEVITQSQADEALDEHFNIDEVIDIRKSLVKSSGKGKTTNDLCCVIKWAGYERTTEEPYDEIESSAPLAIAQYALKKYLLNETKFEWCRQFLLDHMKLSSSSNDMNQIEMNSARSSVLHVNDSYDDNDVDNVHSMKSSDNPVRKELSLNSKDDLMKDHTVHGAGSESQSLGVHLKSPEIMNDKDNFGNGCARVEDDAVCNNSFSKDISNMHMRGGQESNITQSIYMSSDEDSDEYDIENESSLSVGDKITYWHPQFIFGGSQGLRHALIVGIDKSVENWLLLNNGESIPNWCLVKVVSKASGTPGSIHKGKYMAIDKYKIICGEGKSTGCTLSESMDIEISRIGDIVSNVQNNLIRSRKSLGLGEDDEFLRKYKRLNRTQDRNNQRNDDETAGNEVDEALI